MISEFSICKVSKLTKASRTLDLPLLWLPTTATCGKSSLTSGLICDEKKLKK